MVAIYVVGDVTKGAEEGAEVVGGELIVGCPQTKKQSVNLGDSLGGVAIGEGGNGMVFGEGGLYACGPNAAKQLGVGKQAPIVARWQPVSLGRVVSCVAPGSHHSLLCTSDGAVFACGRGDGGQLGLGDKQKGVTSFTQIGLPAGVLAKQVAVASSARRFENQSASYVLTTAGGVLSFGNNNHMKLGHGQGIIAPCWTPTMVAHAGPALIKISAGKHHVLAVDAAGKVYAWGSGDMGRLGLADRKHRGTPTVVEMLGEAPVDVVVARETFSLALATTTGTVYSWGFGTRGQLGRQTLGMRGDPASPGKVDLTAKVMGLAANDDAVLAFLADDHKTHVVWGQLSLGSLAAASNEPSSTIALGTKLDNILAFDLGPSHALVALKEDLPQIPLGALPDANKRQADAMAQDLQPQEKAPKLDDAVAAVGPVAAAAAAAAAAEPRPPGVLVEPGPAVFAPADPTQA